MLVVFAAEHYAFQVALPTAQRRGSVLPRSRKDQARKAFEKLAKRCLPATHGQLTRAIEREAREHHQRVDELRQRDATAADAAAADEDLEPGADEDLKLDGDDELDPGVGDDSEERAATA